MDLFLLLLLLVFGFCSVSFFYLDDFYKSSVKKPVKYSFLEAVVETVLFLFAIIGFCYIFKP